MTGHGLRWWALLAAVCWLVLATKAHAMSQDEVYTQWAGAAQQFEAQHRLLPDSTAEARWVQRVGGAIVEAWPDRRWVSHSFVVVEGEAPGAWSFPISPVRYNVYVTSGLLGFIRARGGGHPDDLLAGVLGHEIAHLMRDHHLLLYRLWLATHAGSAQRPMAMIGRWQQDDEFEADSYGALYALHAGFGFDGILEFLGLYLRRYGDGSALDAPTGSADGIHPSLMARISELRQDRDALEEAKLLFECGLDLLRVGAWSAARTCFAEVRSNLGFSLSPTVVHDLAYAQLKQYEVSLPAGPPLAQAVATSYVTDPLHFRGPATGGDYALLAEAKASFLKACEMDPHGGFLPPRLGLASVYLYEGDDAQARASLQEVKVGLDEPGYLNLVGVLAERGGDAPAAQRAYAKALGLPAEADGAQAAADLPQVLHPYLPALYNLARLLETRGQPAEAAKVYRLYLRFEGSRSSFGVRAREGLVRCGGELPGDQEPEAVSSFRGIDFWTSGALVVKAALGEPETRHQLASGGAAISLYRYPAQGIAVLLAPGLAGDPVVVLIRLSSPSRAAVAGVRIGDPETTLVERLGRPREVVTEGGGRAWWDYSRSGLAFLVKDGKVTRCVIGGRR